MPSDDPDAAPLRGLDAAQGVLDDLYADLVLPGGGGRGGPWVALGMVSSVDGAAARDGRTADLGGEADRTAFGRLRAAGDVVLVGAGTARDEDYGPPGGGAARRAARVARGLAPRPRLALVTGSLDLDPAARMFSDPDHPPIVLTHAAAPKDREAALRGRAEVLRVGDDRVDLHAGLEALAERGLLRVLCEGGPRLNGALLAAGLVDELFLTLAPTLLAGDAPRIVVDDRQLPTDLALQDLHEFDGELLLRYRVVGGRRRAEH